MSLKHAARKAVQTLIAYGISFSNPDPLPILRKLRNVALIAYSVDDMPAIADSNQEAFTLVNRSDGELRYIVIYNKDLPAPRLRLVLAKELAHVILKHDKQSPEHEWMEESVCFAYHFLCPVQIPGVPKKRINFRPHHESLLWSMKMIQNFESIEEMICHIVDERNRFCRVIGKQKTHYNNEDVEFLRPSDFDQITGWKNCYDIVLDGQTIGHCGE